MSDGPIYRSGVPICVPECTRRNLLAAQWPCRDALQAIVCRPAVERMATELREANAIIAEIRAAARDGRLHPFPVNTIIEDVRRKIAGEGEPL